MYFGCAAISDRRFTRGSVSERKMRQDFCTEFIADALVGMANSLFGRLDGRYGCSR